MNSINKYSSVSNSTTEYQRQNNNEGKKVKDDSFVNSNSSSDVTDNNFHIAVGTNIQTILSMLSSNGVDFRSLLASTDSVSNDIIKNALQVMQDTVKLLSDLTQVYDCIRSMELKNHSDKISQITASPVVYNNACNMTDPNGYTYGWENDLNDLSNTNGLLTGYSVINASVVNNVQSQTNQLVLYFKNMPDSLKQIFPYDSKHNGYAFSETTMNDLGATLNLNLQILGGKSAGYSASSLEDSTSVTNTSQAIQTAVTQANQKLSSGADSMNRDVQQIKTFTDQIYDLLSKCNNVS